MNTRLLQSALKQSGPWQDQEVAVDLSWVRQALLDRIRRINWKQAADDVRRFLKPEEVPSLALWSVEAFTAQVDLLFRER